MNNLNVRQPSQADSENQSGQPRKADVRFAASVIVLGLLTTSTIAAQKDSLQKEALAAMKKASQYYRDKVAVHGGYVYHTTADLNQRWGEGLATESQIWVQPPGTPTVGLAYVKAYEATKDPFYLEALTETANALIHGQLKSGGWTNMIDFNSRGRTAAYRNGKGRGKNNSSFDDGQSQTAIQFLIKADQANQFKNKRIHEAAQYALNALLKAQFPNGGFPQVWTGPVERYPVKKANYPKHDWRTEGRIKNYWDQYTLNDNVCGYLAETLITANEVYKDEKYLNALKRLGDFLILAQMPEPQPGWAQQYNYDMQPIWARKFEPAAIAGDETQEVIQTLLRITQFTGDKKYLKPIPDALAYLKRSLLPNGQLARFYELKTNKPLYMKRRGKVYSLTYDDSNLPSHYGWKINAKLDRIEKKFNDVKEGRTPSKLSVKSLAKRARDVINSLDDQGRWLTVHKGEKLVGQPKIKPGTSYLSSAVFSRNIERLGEYIQALQGK